MIFNTPSSVSLTFSELMNTVFALVAFLVIALIYSRLSKIRRTVKSPRLGILDLTAGEAAAQIATDKVALRDVFQAPQESDREPPQCDILFLYAHLSDEGRVEGCACELREIIRDSGAKVVVLASENKPDSCTSARARKPYGQANLVITFARRGEAFPRFFGRLFARMKEGASMPDAWVQLAPQNPNADNPDSPSTIFLCELGHIRFEY